MIEAKGGCHCGAVRFRAQLPDPPVRALECNCSICRTGGFLHIMVPHDAFTLESGADALKSYRFGTGAAPSASRGLSSAFRPPTRATSNT